MFANNFRRIALAQGLLPCGAPPPAPSAEASPPPPKPASRAPEPCDERDDAA